MLAALSLSPRIAAADGLKLDGFVFGRGAAVDGPPSWMAGGFGRFPDSGGDADGQARFAGRARGEVQAALDWSPSLVWDFHVHGLARVEPAGTQGRRVGVTEAFVEFRPELTASTALRFRLGTEFPPASRENTGRLWTSPYTLTLSALDTWIAEELRPTVLEATVVHKRSNAGDALEIGGAVLGGADSLGALLAWRGWTLGDRLVTIGERLPLPPLATLRPGGAFGRQRDGTTPIAELDGRPGWLAQARWTRGRAGLHVWGLDNRGDRLLHRGQYAWRTRLVSAGATLGLGRLLIIVADGAWGQTGMGPTDQAHVDIDFRTAYVLASLGSRRARLSARYDVFRNIDRDHTAEPDDDDGHAWTAAVMWAPVRRLRLAVEASHVQASRAAALPPASGGRRLQGEVRVGL